MDSAHFPTLLCGVTGVVHTAQGVIASTATQLGAAIPKDNLSRLKENIQIMFTEPRASVLGLNAGLTVLSIKVWCPLGL